LIAKKTENIKYILFRKYQDDTRKQTSYRSKKVDNKESEKAPHPEKAKENLWLLVAMCIYPLCLKNLQKHVPWLEANTRVVIKNRKEKNLC